MKKEIDIEFEKKIFMNKFKIRKENKENKENKTYRRLKSIQKSENYLWIEEDFFKIDIEKVYKIDFFIERLKKAIEEEFNIEKTYTYSSKIELVRIIQEIEKDLIEIICINIILSESLYNLINYFITPNFINILNKIIERKIKIRRQRIEDERDERSKNKYKKMLDIIKELKEEDLSCQIKFNKLKEIILKEDKIYGLKLENFKNLIELKTDIEERFNQLIKNNSCSNKREDENIKIKMELEELYINLVNKFNEENQKIQSLLLSLPEQMRNSFFRSFLQPINFNRFNTFCILLEGYFALIFNIIIDKDENKKEFNEFFELRKLDIV